MQAIIMAGGFGTRIQPLTCTIPKPMVPLVNRPIMLHIVELLKKHQITDLVMLLYHQPSIIKNFFRDGSDFGVKITYVTPLEDMGTAGAVKCAEKHIDGRFLVISGDLLTDFNLKKVIDFHADNRALATVTLTSVKDPLQFGVVITDKERRIVQFLEKPGWGEVISDTINTGIYLFEPEIFGFIPEKENFDFSQDLFPLLLERKDFAFGTTSDDTAFGPVRNPVALDRVPGGSSGGSAAVVAQKRRTPRASRPSSSARAWVPTNDTL